MVSNPEEELKYRIEDIKVKVSHVQGWLHDSAGMSLYQLVGNHAPNGNIVELGSWKGKSTIWLGSAVQDRGEGKVFAVDTWEGSPEHNKLLANYSKDQLFEEFKRNIIQNGLESFAEPIRSDTITASRIWNINKKIGLLFIDASHDYDSVKKDFEFWSPFVSKDGFIVFDDVPSWPGPTKLISQLPNWYEQVAVSPNNWIVQKVK